MWDDLPENFQAFRAELKVEISHPGDIATRPGKAPDQSLPYRIAHRAICDGSRGGIFFADLDNHVDAGGGSAPIQFTLSARELGRCWSR